MLPGFSGYLVSESFLEEELTSTGRQLATADAASVRQRFTDWHRSFGWLGPASTVRALFEGAAAPLAGLLGFAGPWAIETVDPVLIATLQSGSDPVLLVVAPWAARLDGFWRIATSHAIRRAARWSLLFNGTHVRLLDHARPYARRSIEFDLDLMLDHDRTWSAFWLLMRAQVFGATAAGSATLRATIERSERHAAAVSRSLRDGVLAASGAVLGALVGSRRRRTPPPLDGSFEQALTIVYRILFLLFAEARGLVPLWHPVYRDGYSIESLRAAAERPEPAAGLWDALRAIARLAHDGCRAGDLRVTPFNGRLFAPARTPLAERPDLDDNAAKRAVLALSTRPSADRAGRERIGYRDLGVEQLGSVYETLLDYEPRANPMPRRVGRSPSLAVTLVRGSGARKATGSFYTPQPIADYLVRRTLGPLVKDAAPDRILKLRVLDPSMGSGAFLVAACRYLADGYEAALIRTGGCLPTDLDERRRIAIRRAIAERCLYGVDVNPMAVQLARLSLWLATLAADRPLTFLDHHLQTGDSLLGTWMANLRRGPSMRPARAKDSAALPLFGEDDVAEALKAALPLRFSLEDTPADTIDQVRAKERALAALGRRETLLSKWKRVADLWCAPWFATTDAPVPASAFGALSDVVLTGSGPLAPGTADRYLDRAAVIARTRRLFHWELEFPEVFFDTEGRRLPHPGFDAVIGNPPWDMIRADARPAATRAQSRAGTASLLRFARDAGVYSAHADGHANRYQLFLERSMALTKPGGRIGMVLPSGLATDHGNRGLRRDLLTRCDVDALVGFDNQQAVFPIHRSVRFLLLTASCGRPTQSIACRMGERNPAALDDLGDESAAASAWFPVRLTPALLQRLSGEDLVIPDIRTAADLSIVERAVSLFAPLGSEAGWRVRFGRELNATDDRPSFGPPGSGLAVIEGKQIDPFRVDVNASRFSITPERARTLLDPDRYQRPRLAYRDVAGATNRLTLIAAVLPAHCVSTHTVFCLRSPLPSEAQHFLSGLFNSFVVNYFVRMRVTLHVTTAVVEGLPMPARGHAPRAFREIAALARLLSRRDDSEAFARLQALVAGLYQLSTAEFEHVLHISTDSRKDARGLTASLCCRTAEPTKMNSPQSHRVTELNALTQRIIGAAIEVHKALGPGLLESIYEAALCIELEDATIAYTRQVRVPAYYKGRLLGEYRVDLIVEDLVLVEIKSVEHLNPVFEAQLLTNMRLTGKRLGLLLNFNSRLMKDGVMRRIL